MQILWIYLLLRTTTFADILKSIYPTTVERIVAAGYPVEQHTAQTLDGYILTIFRIPYSTKTKNQFQSNKTAIYMQHGIVASSDDWVLSGADNALAYLAADAGYDVWLGNFRGNIYSNSHITHSPKSKAFWAFSFHENGIYDLPAAFDYVLRVNGKDALHYVGHSMAAATLAVLLSTKPEYTKLVQTAHLLAPVLYVNHLKSLAFKIAAPILGKPSAVSEAYSDHSIIDYNKFIAYFAAKTCNLELLNRQLCGNLLFLLGGFDPLHTNHSLIPDIVLTHPNGGSSNQLINFCQLYLSGYFRRYDYGLIGNIIHYNQWTPPEYQLERIRAVPPIQLYYSDSDYLSSDIDVMRLLPRMGNNIELHKLEQSPWNHFDYLWALQVKEVINDKILAYVGGYNL